VSVASRILPRAKNAAMLSGTIRSMLSTPAEFSEKQSNEIRFRQEGCRRALEQFLIFSVFCSEIPTQVLEKVIEYFYFKLKYSNSTTEIPGERSMRNWFNC
jgi:transcription elongation factor B subunit 1